jgi:hypothetical protein
MLVFLMESNDMPISVKPIDSANACGTHLQDYVTATYAELVEIFGEPEDGDYKTDAEWCLQFTEADGRKTIATIYNYKDGANYLGSEGTPTEQITEWHIGGTERRAVTLVKQFLAGR